jgi:hypothetical protein
MRLSRRAPAQERAEEPDPNGNLANTLTQFAEPPECERQGAGDHAGRDATLTRREERVEAREAALAARTAEVHRILVAADERDAVSDALDASADERDRELDLAEMLDTESNYGAHWSQRRAAALDRRRAKHDRAASREDRMALIRGLVGPHPGSG